MDDAVKYKILGLSASKILPTLPRGESPGLAATLLHAKLESLCKRMTPTTLRAAFSHPNCPSAQSGARVRVLIIDSDQTSMLESMRKLCDKRHAITHPAVFKTRTLDLI